MSDSKDFVIEKGILKKYVGSGGDVVIPDGVKTVGDGAFFFCSNLTHVTIPDKVMSIGQMAFSGCQKLTLHARAGSYAEQYAKENEIPFSALVIRK